jgi:hypothetical protein
MSITKTARYKKMASGTPARKKTTSKKAARRRPTLSAANKWLTEEHDRILKLAEKNTARLTGKPRL